MPRSRSLSAGGRRLVAAAGRVPLLGESGGEAGFVGDDRQGVFVEGIDRLEDVAFFVGQAKAVPLEQGEGRPLDDRDAQARGEDLLDAGVLDPGQAPDLGPHGLEVAEEDVAEARHGEVVLERLTEVVLGADDLDLADGQLVPGDEEEIGLAEGQEEARLEREQEEDVADPEDAPAPVLLEGQGLLARPEEQAAGEERRLPLPAELAR